MNFFFKIPVLRVPKLSKEALSKLSAPSRTKSKKRPVLIDKQIANFYAQKKTETFKNNQVSFKITNFTKQYFILIML